MVGTILWEYRVCMGGGEGWAGLGLIWTSSVEMKPTLLQKVKLFYVTSVKSRSSRSSVNFIYVQLYIFPLILNVSSQVLGVLSQDGIIRFINIHSCKLLFEVCSHDDGIASAAISPSGRHLATVMESGALNIYSIQALTRDINRV